MMEPIKIPFSERSEEEKDFHAASMKQLQEMFANDFGLFLFPCFGTLIGAVRENDFLGHDHDIDMVWIANGKNRPEICRHVLAVYHELYNRGKMFYGVGNAVGQCNVSVKRKMKLKSGAEGNSTTVIDVFVAWVEDGEFYTCQWGNLGEVDTDPAKISFRNETILIPNGTDAILSKLYGNYRVPSDDHPSKRLKRFSYLTDLF